MRCRPFFPFMTKAAFVVFTCSAFLIQYGTPFARTKGIKIKESYKPSVIWGGSTPNRYAVVIGISRYKHKRLHLTYADRDATALYNFLISPYGGHFDRNKVRLLLNEKATSSAVRSAIGTFLATTQEDDYAIIYFSGHGSPTCLNPKDLYLLTYEADPQDLAGTAFPMDEVKRYLNKSIRAKRVVMIADTCYSGGLRLMGPTAERGENPITLYLNKLARSRKGVVAISATGQSQLAIEDSKYGVGHGIFTYYLLKSLTTDSPIADSDHDGVVTTREAFVYTYNRVKAETKGMQVPTISGDTANCFPLATVNKESFYQELQNLHVYFSMFKETRHGKALKIKDGDTLYSGDGYFFYLKPNRRCYVYLFQSDAAGKVYRLFPNAIYHTPTNPLLPNIDVLLPNPREVYYLDKTLGTEEIYLFASKTKLAELENFICGNVARLDRGSLRFMDVAGVRRQAGLISRQKQRLDTLFEILSGNDKFLYKMSFLHK